MRNRLSYWLMSAVVIVGLAAATSGCSLQPEPGPVERIGRGIDEAMKGIDQLSEEERRTEEERRRERARSGSYDYDDSRRGDYGSNQAASDPYYDSDYDRPEYERDDGYYRSRERGDDPQRFDYDDRRY